MTAVATLRGSWKPENSNAASALTETAAGLRIVRKLVKAGIGRPEAFTRFKDRLSVRGFQADLSGLCEDFAFGIGLAALRSPIGRG